jgi:hypothetical protein
MILCLFRLLRVMYAPQRSSPRAAYSRVLRISEGDRIRILHKIPITTDSFLVQNSLRAQMGNIVAVIRARNGLPQTAPIDIGPSIIKNGGVIVCDQPRNMEKTRSASRWKSKSSTSTTGRRKLKTPQFLRSPSRVSRNSELVGPKRASLRLAC